LNKLVIEGGKPLSGTTVIHGAKNSALPILAAACLAKGQFQVDNIPGLLDIEVMLHILRELGCQAEQVGSVVNLDTTHMVSSHIPEQLMRKMRSSIFLMGPLLARFGLVTIYQPGGCAIGERKIDLHLQGLLALGAKIEEEGSKVTVSSEQLVGVEVYLDFPSVGATENIMMAAACAQGTTTISNAAREPEIQDLQNFLNAMGARVSGAGTDVIVIEGVAQTSLHGCAYTVIPDRIVTGTVMVAVAAAMGRVELHKVEPQHLTALIHILRRIGVQIITKQDTIIIENYTRFSGIDRIVTQPYPAFPTDLQSQVMVLLSLADGVSVMKETIFEGRFMHVDELSRMGADIRVDYNAAIIRGVPKLFGATVRATDLRAGAALVIAGLAAHGTTTVERVDYIDRGYDHIEDLFSGLGADIQRVSNLNNQ
jgi:UDP-N-acetylglucosamine 1-carboxyvinyltransferase